ncbi:MAG: FAD-dependent oxidoreductase [Hyphomicrobiaceae bacterium]
MPEKTHSQTCCIAGAGPAGLMLGLLLSRAGIQTTVVEKHDDFLRDFRGDTIHPSTMEAMAELGYLDEFLSLPHQKATKLYAAMDGEEVTIADFSRLPTRCRYMAFMPQWDFLAFLSRKAKAQPSFRLLMGKEVTRLVGRQGRVAGVEVRDRSGIQSTIPADLVVGADGRNSVVRRLAGLEILKLGAPTDVLWMQVSRRPEDIPQAMSHGGPRQSLVLIDRGAYWQCGYVIPKGTFDEVRGEGLVSLRKKLAAIAALPGDRFEELTSSDQIKLLRVDVDRLKQWWRPGVLCIGDAAHAMSPIGGVGVGLAIQDAIAASNILSAPLLDGRMDTRHLKKVQRRRNFPTKATQTLQVMMRRRRRPPVEHGTARAPAFLRAMARWPLLPHLAGKLIGLGIRPEHVAR